jgi:hypothetical protein
MKGGIIDTNFNHGQDLLDPLHLMARSTLDKPAENRSAISRFVFDYELNLVNLE